MSEFEEGGLDSFLDWFRQNSRLLTIGGGAIAAAAVGVVLWKKSADTRIQNAEKAYYQAQTATGQDPTKGTAELEKVATRYSGTSAGDRAALMMAQSLLQAGKPADALKQLEKLAAGGGAARLGSTLQTLMAASYEGLNRPADAAKAYLTASQTSAGDAKMQRQADAARAYMAAGNDNEAMKLWTELAKDDRGPLADEAHVRLGELVVKP
jgi:predicted negative regulator of RcsB-dependent stress response